MADAPVGVKRKAGQGDFSRPPRRPVRSNSKLNE